MSSEYHSMPRWIYLIDLLDSERNFFTAWYFVLKVCITISLLGYNLVIADRKMHFMVFLHFSATSHPTIRMSNLLTAESQCLFSYPNIFSRKKFHTPTKIHHFVSAPIQITPPTPRSKPDHT